jgi:anti-sigma factor ChrR (cupin superfamily)
MNTRWLKATGVGAALLFTAQGYAADQKAQVQLVPSMLHWLHPFGPNGPERADISGDEEKGPYSYFLKLPPGFDAGLHTHDHDYTAVVLGGVIENVEQGAEALARPMPAGSVWTQPAKRAHTTRCVSPAPCLVYVASAGGASFHPVLTAGARAAVSK